MEEASKIAQPLSECKRQSRKGDKCEGLCREGLEQVAMARVQCRRLTWDYLLLTQRGLILIIQHVNKQSQIILTQEKHWESCHQQTRFTEVLDILDIFSSVWSAVVFPCVQGGYRSSHSPPLAMAVLGDVWVSHHQPPPGCWCFHPASSFYTWLTSENITADINPTVQVLIRRQNTTEAPVNLFLLGTPDLLLTKCFLLCVNIRFDCKCPSELGSSSSPHLLPSGRVG